LDIREIQALHAQYSSQPIVIDIDSHVRALPAPAKQESTRERVIARLTPTCRRVSRPTVIVVALALGAGVAGICAAKLWQSLHAPQSAVHIDPTTPHITGIAPASAGAALATSGSKRPLTSADFAEPTERTTASQPRVNAEALRAPELIGSPALTKPPTSAALYDQERAAASPIRAPRPAAGPAASQPPTSPVPGQDVSAATVTLAVAAPTVQPATQPKVIPHRVHRAPARQRQDAASAEASATMTRTEAAKPDHAPKSATPAKAGDVPLF
jgi:hypothetical protein